MRHGFRVTDLELYSRAYSPAVACWTGRLNCGISVIRVVFASIRKASFVQVCAPTKLGNQRLVFRHATKGYFE